MSLNYESGRSTCEILDPERAREGDPPIPLLARALAHGKVVDGDVERQRRVALPFGGWGLGGGIRVVHLGRSTWHAISGLVWGCGRERRDLVRAIQLRVQLVLPAP